MRVLVWFTDFFEFIVRQTGNSLSEPFFWEVSFRFAKTSLLVGLVIFAGFLFRFALWPVIKKRTHFLFQSGYSVDHHRERLTTKVLYATPKAFVVLFLFFSIVALAEPYEPFLHKETRVVEMRERFDLIDVSSSMSSVLSSEESKAEVAREALLNFLNLRKEKKDRACLWVFSDNPYRIQNCTTDDAVYRFQVFSAPLLLSSSGRGRGVVRIYGESGTNLRRALRALVKNIDEEEKRGAGSRRRILLMITDAQITTYPREELEDLSRRGVIPYVLWIRAQGSSASTRQFFRGISRYGGQVYQVGEEESLDRAFSEIDARETSEIEEEEYSIDVSLFQKPLFLSIFCMMIALILGAVVELFLGSRVT